jgi:hypothetical protein
MHGMNRHTGSPLIGDDHLAQSIGDILTTPIGSRVMLRDYGSRLLELIDYPLNASTRLSFIAAIAEAVTRWEPRLRLSRVDMSAGSADGSATIIIEGQRLDRPDQPFTRLAIPLS